jgi:hypothetical protein
MREGVSELNIKVRLQFKTFVKQSSYIKELIFLFQNFAMRSILGVYDNNRQRYVIHLILSCFSPKLIEPVAWNK